jgi:hypothetical protein
MEGSSEQSLTNAKINSGAPLKAHFGAQTESRFSKRWHTIHNPHTAAESDNDSIFVPYIYNNILFDPKRNFWLDKGLSGQTASQPGRCYEKELNFHPPFVLCAKMLMAAAKAEEEELNTTQQQASSEQFSMQRKFIPRWTGAKQNTLWQRVLFSHTRVNCE